MVISPDRGDGARMSRVEIADSPGGRDLTFTDYDATIDYDPDPDGDFRDFLIAEDVSRTAPHTLRFEMDFVEGRENDRVRVFSMATM